jgi:hypothetical protein
MEIAKLQTQLASFSKNIDGKIMMNNIKLVHINNFKDAQKLKMDCDALSDMVGKISDSEYKTRCDELRQRRTDLRAKQKKQREYEALEPTKLITLKEFQNNISHIPPANISPANKNVTDLIKIKPEIKMYDDIIPIFTTMMDIMKKQQDQINILNTKLCL